MTMERKIGEIFENNGEWYQCVKYISIKHLFAKEMDLLYADHVCSHCDCFGNICEKAGSCSHTNRTDGTEVVFKKFEPVGEPYPLYGHIVQRYAGVANPIVLPKEPFADYNAINDTVDIEVKQDKENTEDMETNEKTITIPDGWEFDRIDGNGNIVLKEKKTELPKTWLKCLKCVNDLELIDTGNNIEKWNFTTLDNNGWIFGRDERHLLPRGLGKPMIALCQLLVCRNAWWQQLGWKPDWRDRKSLKHCIHSDGFSTTDITRHSTFPRILAFPTEDTAIDFRDTFRGLIEKAKELL